RRPIGIDRTKWERRDSLGNDVVRSCWMRRRVVSVALLIGSCLLLATCGSPDSAADKAKIAELQAENDKLKAQLAALQSNGAAAATNTASNSAAGTPAPPPAFSDISGI